MPPLLSPEKIADLLFPFLGGGRLSDAQLNQVSAYLDLLLRWNAKVNLTAVREPEEIITRHFGESFFAACHLLPRTSPCEIPTAGKSARTAIDIGSGAGFPGLPMKVFDRDLDLTLIESNQKKAAFLREVIRLLRLTGVNVIAGRAERIEAGASRVTLRAVERFDAVLPVAARLVASDGRLALLIGTAQLESAKSILGSHKSKIGTANSQIGNIRWSEPIPIPLSRNRILAIVHFDWSKA